MCCEGSEVEPLKNKLLSVLSMKSVVNVYNKATRIKTGHVVCK